MDLRSISIIDGYVPGCFSSILELESKFYKEQFSLNYNFDLKIARALLEFLLRYEPKRDGLWLVLVDGRVEGSIAVDGKNAHLEGAQLRWFIVSPLLRDAGLGNSLLSTAVNFCREKHYRRLYLWTFDTFSPAKHLYEKYGFKITHKIPCTYRGFSGKEERFELHFGSSSHPAVKTYHITTRRIIKTMVHIPKISSLLAFSLGVLSTMMVYKIKYLRPVHISHILQYLLVVLTTVISGY